MNDIAYKKLNSDLKFVYSENDTISIIFQSNDILLGVVGEFNNNLKHGQGEMNYTNNARYKGTWSQDLVSQIQYINYLSKDYCCTCIARNFYKNSTLKTKILVVSIALSLL